ncbi:MAG TPA: DoxX family protein [Dehalococcoidia bacterium]|nr:DoxX family protein [Dehalococcoidia bacterium]
MKNELFQNERRPLMHKGLWIVQGALALLFLATGVMKLAMPIQMLNAQMPVPLPGLFLRFLGTAEFLGGLGMFLPGLLRIRQGLTPLAAVGLLIIMIGATVFTVTFMGIAPALLPLVAGLLATFVAYGRWRVAPLRAWDQRTLRPSPARG